MSDKIDYATQIHMFKEHMQKVKTKITSYSDKNELNELEFTKGETNTGADKYTRTLRPSLCKEICLITNERIYHITQSNDKRTFNVTFLDGQTIKAQKIELELICSRYYSAMAVRGIVQKDTVIFELKDVEHILFKYKKDMVELSKETHNEVHIEYAEYGSC